MRLGLFILFLFCSLAVFAVTSDELGELVASGEMTLGTGETFYRVNLTGPAVYKVLVTANNFRSYSVSHYCDCGSAVYATRNRDFFLKVDGSDYRLGNPNPPHTSVGACSCGSWSSCYVYENPPLTFSEVYTVDVSSSSYELVLSTRFGTAANLLQGLVTSGTLNYSVFKAVCPFTDSCDVYQCANCGMVNLCRVHMDHHTKCFPCPRSLRCVLEKCPTCSYEICTFHNDDLGHFVPCDVCGKEFCPNFEHKKKCKYCNQIVCPDSSHTCVCPNGEDCEEQPCGFEGCDYVGCIKHKPLQTTHWITCDSCKVLHCPLDIQPHDQCDGCAHRICDTSLDHSLCECGQKKCDGHYVTCPGTCKKLVCGNLHKKICDDCQKTFLLCEFDSHLVICSGACATLVCPEGHRVLCGECEQYFFACENHECKCPNTKDCLEKHCDKCGRDYCSFHENPHKCGVICPLCGELLCNCKCGSCPDRPDCVKPTFPTNHTFEMCQGKCLCAKASPTDPIHNAFCVHKSSDGEGSEEPDEGGNSENIDPSSGFLWPDFEFVKILKSKLGLNLSEIGEVDDVSISLNLGVSDSSLPFLNVPVQVSFKSLPASLSPLLETFRSFLRNFAAFVMSVVFVLACFRYVNK